MRILLCVLVVVIGWRCIHPNLALSSPSISCFILPVYHFYHHSPAWPTILRHARPITPCGLPLSPCILATERPTAPKRAVQTDGKRLSRYAGTLYTLHNQGASCNGNQNTCDRPIVDQWQTHTCGGWP